MQICDLHGLRFEEGKDKLIRFLNRCLVKHEKSIQIVHGYHGRAFKDYIQSPDFLDEMEEEGIYIIEMNISKNPGSTDITLDL